MGMVVRGGWRDIGTVSTLTLVNTAVGTPIGTPAKSGAVYWVINCVEVHLRVKLLEVMGIRSALKL